MRTPVMNYSIAGCVGFGFDLHGEDVVFPLNEEIHFVRWVVLAPITGHDFKLLLTP